MVFTCQSAGPRHKAPVWRGADRPLAKQIKSTARHKRSASDHRLARAGAGFARELAPFWGLRRVARPPHGHRPTRPQRGTPKASRTAKSSKTPLTSRNSTAKAPWRARALAYPPKRGLHTCSGVRARGSAPPKATRARARSFGDDVDRLEPLRRHRGAGPKRPRHHAAPPQEVHGLLLGDHCWPGLSRPRQRALRRAR